MTSRWMQQKRQRQKTFRERALGVNVRFAIIDRIGSVAVPMPDAPPQDDSALIAAYLCNGGVVKREPCKGIMPRDSMSLVGKGKRQLDKKCYGERRKRIKQGALIGSWGA